jgi:sarcosine oxidase subunit alpha
VPAVALARLTGTGDGPHGLTPPSACELVAVAGGWNPTIHLHSQSRGRPIYDADRAMFLPGASVQGERSAGGCAGVFALDEVLRSGAEAGAGAAVAAGFKADPPPVPDVPRDHEIPPRTMWQMPSSRPEAKAKCFIDFQNDVSAADI